MQWGLFLPQLRAEGLLVRVTCSSSCLQHPPFSWGLLLALKDTLFQKCLPTSGWVRALALSTADLILPSITLQVPPPLAWVLLRGKKQFESYPMTLASHRCLRMSE